jgi:hypothetical protein
MTSNFVLSIGIVLAIAAWAVIAHFRRHLRTCQHQEIVRCGACCDGKVVGILRPSLVDACTRLYFEFEPPGASRPLRVCHIDQAPLGQSRAALLRTGEVIRVRYLPERPRQAVISSLI